MSSNPTVSGDVFARAIGMPGRFTRKVPPRSAGPAATYAWAREQAEAMRARLPVDDRPATGADAPTVVPCPECGGRGYTGTGATWADECDNPGCRLGFVSAYDLANPPCPICRGDGATRRPGLRIGDPAFGKAEPCSCPRDAVTAGGSGMVTRFTLAAAGMPAKYHAMTLGSWAERVAASQGSGYDAAGGMVRVLMAGRLEAEAQGRHGLIVIGRTGRGKSGLAAGAFREYLASGRAARWVPWQSYCDSLNAMRNDGENDRDVLARDIRAQFLVLDDLGSEGKATDHRTRVLLEILENRHGRPTIITTMHGFERLAELYGEHNIGRIIEGFQPVHLDGRDLRANGGAE